MMDGDVGYPLFDLTSSGLNQGNRRWRALEKNRHRVATMNLGDNYGMVRIDWDKKDPVVSLEIHDDEGDVTIRRKVPLSRLQVEREEGKGNAAGLAAEALEHVDKEWTVEMTVNATGANRGKTMTFLNSETRLPEREEPDDRAGHQGAGGGPEEGEDRRRGEALRRQEDQGDRHGDAVQQPAADPRDEAVADQGGRVNKHQKLHDRRTESARMKKEKHVSPKSVACASGSGRFVYPSSYFFSPMQYRCVCERMNSLPSATAGDAP